jgi:hypothetical protein
MGILLPEFLHSVLQRASRLASTNKFAIEELHQLRGALIVHVPQRQKQSASTSAEEATLKPEQLVAGSDEIHSGSTTAQRH